MAELEDWNITKAEWDGIVLKVERQRFGFRILLLVYLLIVAGLSAAWYFGNSPVFAKFLLLFTPVMLVCGVGGWIWHRRANPRWVAWLGVVWEARGCACPWCKTRVDTTPCERHGFSAAQHALLLGYWEAIATLNMEAVGLHSAELLRIAPQLRPPRSTASRLWQGAIGPYRRARAHAATVFHDPKATMFMRLCAAIPVWLYTGSVCVIVGSLVYACVGRAMFFGLLRGCWWYFPAMLIPVFMGPIARVGRLRCTKCSQLCADAKPIGCPECGSDLTRPGAVNRMSHPVGYRWTVFLIIPLMMFAPMTGGFGLMAQLPLSSQIWCYSWVGVPFGFFRSINVSALSPGEAASAAELLIAQAAPEGARPVFDFDFLENALALGKVPESTREAAARAVVLATLEVSTTDGVTTATVAPEFGELIFGRGATPRLVFGGISVDGGAWSASSTLSLMHHDLDSFWRALEPSPHRMATLPESQLRFVTELAIAPGTHEIRARGWIVLWGEAYKRFAPTFNDDGTLITTPTMSGVYEIEMIESVTVW